MVQRGEALIGWLNDNQGAVIAVLTLVLVAITGFYAWQNRRMVDEMRASRRQAVAPQFVLDLNLAGPQAVFLDVHNAGSGPALNGTYEIRLHLKEGRRSVGPSDPMVGCPLPRGPRTPLQLRR